MSTPQISITLSFSSSAEAQEALAVLSAHHAKKDRDVQAAKANYEFINQRAEMDAIADRLWPTVPQAI